MTTGPPARDDRYRGNGHRGPAAAAGPAGGDRAGAGRARLAGLWALALQRFRDYAHKNTGPAGCPARRHEEDR
jgi:hypothetical protein